MRVFKIGIFLLILLSACSPSSTELIAPLDISPTIPSPTAVAPTPAASATLPELEEEMPEPLLPTATPTPLPVVFDLNGYQEFSVSRIYYPGLEQYWEQGYWTEITRALSPKGDRIAFSACWGSMDSAYECESPDSGLLLVLDTNTGELVTEIPLGSSWPGGVAFSADGQTLLYGTTDYIALWDLTANSPGLTLLEQAVSGRLRFPAVAAAPDRQSYAALVEQTLYVWDPTGQLLMQTPAALTRLGYASLTYSADGTRMAFIAPERTGIEVYDTSNWELMRGIETEHIFDLALSPGAQWLAAIDSESDTAIVWNLDTGAPVAELDPEQQVGYVRFNPAGDLLVIAGPGNYDTPDAYTRIGTLYETMQWSMVEQRHSYVDWGQVEFSQDGKRMAMMGEFTKVIYETTHPELLAGLEALEDFQNALHNGDYARAAALFDFDPRDEDFWREQGLQPDDVAGSFERMCAAKTIFCYPVLEVLDMGCDWYGCETLVYLVRLDNDGPFISENGDQVFEFYLEKTPAGIKVVFLPY
jgi:DNA-binding beta-propeller fold protein YncE